MQTSAGESPRGAAGRGTPPRPGFHSQEPLKAKEKSRLVSLAGAGKRRTEQPTASSKQAKRPPDSTSPGEGQAPSAFRARPAGGEREETGVKVRLGTQGANRLKFDREGGEGARPPPTVLGTPQNEGGFLPGSPHTCQGESGTQSHSLWRKPGATGGLKAGSCRQACHSTRPSLPVRHVKGNGSRKSREQ